jgi:hypothetical protein
VRWATGRNSNLVAEGRKLACARLGLIVHHTDAEREWAYDRNSHVGKLNKAFDSGKAAGWTIVDMKRDWKRIFAE